MARYGQVQAFVPEALCFINEAPARPRLRESDDDDDKTKNEEKGPKGEEEVGKVEEVERRRVETIPDKESRWKLLDLIRRSSCLDLSFKEKRMSSDVFHSSALMST